MPIIHGRTYAEPEGWTMPSPEFRILVAPAAMAATSQHLGDIDALGIFLRSLPGVPCHLRFLSVGNDRLVTERFAGMSTRVTHLTADVRPEVLQRVRKAFGDRASEQASLVDLLAHGVEARVDVVVPYPVPTDPSPSDLAKALDIAVCDWHEAKHACEVFVRGHEVPWAFKALSWGLPWSHLYLIAEPAERLIALRDRAQERVEDPDARELVRSLAFNRHPTLAFTRDRLLFYVQQQRMARRFGVRRSDFVFEVNYYLNHYYLLLWAGLDHLCLITNALLNLGLPREQVGIAKAGFRRALRGGPLHLIVTDAKFVAWRKMLSSARHLAAHRGITMASQMYFAPEHEPSDAELDAAIEASDKWRANVVTFGAAEAERYREVFRIEERVRRMRQFPERVMPVEIDGQRKLIVPLINIEYDFEQFMLFANKMANELLGHLEASATTGS